MSDKMRNTLLLLFSMFLLSCANENKDNSINIKPSEDSIYEYYNDFITFPSPVELSLRLRNENLIDTSKLLQSNFLDIPSVKKKYFTSKNNLSAIKGIIHQNILLAMAINDTTRVEEYFKEYRKLLVENKLSVELEQVNDLLNHYDNDSILSLFFNENENFQYQLSFNYEYIYYLLKYFKEIDYKENTHLLSGILDLRYTLSNIRVTGDNENLFKIIKYMTKIYVYSNEVEKGKNINGETVLKNGRKYIFKRSDIKYFEKIFDIVKKERMKIIR